MRTYLSQKRELIAFAVAGVLTTAVNYISYSMMTAVYGLNINLSNVIAWILAVLTGFFANKALVFQKRDWSPGMLAREGSLFVGSRLFSGAVTIGLVPVLMQLGVTQRIFGVPGAVAKLLAEAIEMVLNYFLSKYAVFRNNQETRSYDTKEDSLNREQPVSVEYHADDYGLFPTQSRRILDCAENGVLNAVSVMTNGPHLAACMEAFQPYSGRAALSVHLNFMEGRAFCPGLLTDGTGIFHTSFGALLLHSFLPDRGKYRAALREEIRAQIHGLLPYLGEGRGIRVDGHAHYHMLPVVFDALMDVIREEGLSVSYIRVPADPIRLYLRHWGALEGFRPVNLVKVLVLDLLAWRNTRKYRDFFQRTERRVFLGVLFSGNMRLQNVSAVLPEAEALAARKGWGVEILAHPGGVYEPEDVEALTHRDDRAFLTSASREREAEMFIESQGAL